MSTIAPLGLKRILALIGLLGVVLQSNALWARDKTDLIYLVNGDRITGEIKNLQRGLLSVSTDSMGTVSIEWADIVGIESTYRFDVELSSGRRLVSSLSTGTDAGMVMLNGVSEGRVDVAQLSIVRINQLEARFLDRFKGSSIDLSSTVTSTNDSRDLAVATHAQYRVEKYLASIDYNFLVNTQKDVETRERSDISLYFLRYLPDRWFIRSVTEITHSEEIELDRRIVLGGALGRNLVQNNHLVFSVLGGASYNREKFFEEGVQSSTEALAGASLEAFRYNSPKLNLTTSFLAYPGLSNFGRLRLKLNSSLRFELIKDFFFSFNLYETFDTDPPQGSRRNDYGATTGFGYKF